jgi:hypothetical protein
MAILAGAVSEMALWTPADITTALWLDAADSATLFDAVSGGSTPAADGAVARWEDKSGNARHVTQSISGNRPARKVALLNGLDALRFDGFNDLMSSGANSPSLTGFTCFAVQRHASFGGNDFGRIIEVGSGFAYFVASATRIFRFISGGTFQDAAGDSATINTWRVAGITHDLTNASSGTVHRVNGSISFASHTASTTAVPSANSVVQIGNRTDTLRGFNGDFGEILYLPVLAALSIVEQIEGYLAHKWGLTASLPNDHPYKNSAPTTGAIQVRRRRSRSGGGVL